PPSRLRPRPMAVRHARNAIIVSPTKSASMPTNKSKTPQITALNEVGRYAIGVRWADGHGSSSPVESWVRECPCKASGGGIAGEIPAASQRLGQLSRLGERRV